MMTFQLKTKINYLIVIISTILMISCSYKKHEFNYFISEIETRQKYLLLLKTDESKLEELLETQIYGDLVMLSFAMTDRNDYFNKDIWIDRMCDSLDFSMKLNNEGIIDLELLLDKNSDEYDNYIKVIEFCKKKK